ncbi:helix-turn-helix transcriptional regulator [Streptococcus hongkongensis]|nr:transcriptional regulator [Streptococcus uberis]
MSYLSKSEVFIIQFTTRQKSIISIVKEKEPITGEKIADLLQVTRATLRSDLVVLTMLGVLDAKPKVGYFYVGKSESHQEYQLYKNMKVSDIMGIPQMAHQNDSVYDVIVQIFMEDSGGVFILDESDYLCGLVSRKDLLKATIGSGDLTKLPIGMIMTRVPNVSTVSGDEFVLSAAEKLVAREVDSLPVVEQAEHGKLKVIGKLSKTIITKLFLELKEK